MFLFIILPMIIIKQANLYNKLYTFLISLRFRLEIYSIYSGSFNNSIIYSNILIFSPKPSKEVENAP